MESVDLIRGSQVEAATRAPAGALIFLVRSAAAALAAKAFPAFRATTFAERAEILNAVAKILDAEREDAARVITLEMGKPLKAARAEVAKCAQTFRYYARHGEAFLADEPADARAVKARQAYVRYQPLGPVLAVMPWNFPLFQVTRFAKQV